MTCKTSIAGCANSALPAVDNKQQEQQQQNQHQQHFKLQFWPLSWSPPPCCSLLRVKMPKVPRQRRSAGLLGVFVLLLGTGNYLGLSFVSSGTTSLPAAAVRGEQNKVGISRISRWASDDSALRSLLLGIDTVASDQPKAKKGAVEDGKTDVKASEQPKAKKGAAEDGKTDVKATPGAKPIKPKAQSKAVPIAKSVKPAVQSKAKPPQRKPVKQAVKRLTP
ncbi:unnamed protein product [Polarella glacialis]|uniref:Uncharacterized protein n=1 Tax=Polarella glacialis TaxID=89957 RepID=A0A813FK03_POLGL|nr:unnamed protein product [Polarella glacialis]